MLMRFDPFREVDRLMGQLSAGGRAAPMSFPMDAIRRGDRFLVYLDLPGVTPDSIDLTVDRNVLTIRAERTYAPEEGDQILITERPQGEFTRQLMLGDTLDSGRLEARYEHGVLEIAIPLAERAKPRRIEVNAGAGPQTIEGSVSDPATGGAARQEREAGGGAGTGSPGDGGQAPRSNPTEHPA